MCSSRRRSRARRPGRRHERALSSPPLPSCEEGCAAIAFQEFTRETKMPVERIPDRGASPYSTRFLDAAKERGVCPLACRSDRNLPPDLDDLVGRQAEEIADMDGVALHHGKDPLLPRWQAAAVLA